MVVTEIWEGEVYSLPEERGGKWWYRRSGRVRCTLYLRREGVSGGDGDLGG